MFKAPISNTPFPPVNLTGAPAWDGIPGGMMFLAGSPGIPSPCWYDAGTGKVYLGNREVNAIWVKYDAAYKIGASYYTSYSYGQGITIYPLSSTSPIVARSVALELGTSLIDTTGWDGFYLSGSFGLMFKDSPNPVWPNWLGPAYNLSCTFNYNYP